MKIIAVIPAYNEEATLAGVVQRTLAHCPVIVVNDGSCDNTAQLLADLPVTVIHHATNLGKAESLRRGLLKAMEAGADLIISLDADGQHAPEDIPHLVERARQHPQTIVIGARLKELHCMPPVRRFGNAMANFWISWAAGQRITDTQSGFRVYPANLFKQMPIQSNSGSGFVFESEILIKSSSQGYGFIMEPISAHYPVDARPSHYRPISDTWAIIVMVARHLLRRGMYPVGLYRSLRSR